VRATTDAHGPGYPPSMKHLLLRARKDAFDVVSPEDSLVRNTIADNSGNLIFSVAAQRLLATATADVTVDRFVIDPGDADRINERYDAYVIPLANAFRPSYEPTLHRLTALIRRLRIPVVVLGVGAQADVHYRTERLRPIEPAVRAFVGAALDHAPSIGVRGELTQSYLEGLGFRDVEVIGCPSLFIDGRQLRVDKPGPVLAPDARVAINVSPYVTAMGPIVRRHVERYPNLRYIPQDIDTLELLLWGGVGEDVPASEPRPIHPAHPLFRDDRARFFVDPWPWLAYLRTVDFSFGTRIHGNIAALMAGTPAVVLAHDSRTLELARYFAIPHRRIGELPADIDAADLYAEADYTAFNDGHAARFATFAAYLARHGLDHAFAAGETDPPFDTRAAATAYPPAVTAASRRPPRGVAGRIRRIRRRARRQLRGAWVRRARVALARRRGRTAGPDA
jgi:Polysaccharide pyruvyl transferase